VQSSVVGLPVMQQIIYTCMIVYVYQSQLSLPAVALSKHKAAYSPALTFIHVCLHWRRFRTWRFCATRYSKNSIRGENISSWEGGFCDGELCPEGEITLWILRIRCMPGVCAAARHALICSLIAPSTSSSFAAALVQQSAVHVVPLL